MKLKLLATILTVVVLVTGLGADANAQNGKKKILIAYFSQSGNTKVIAEQIKKHTGGDLFRIETEQTYPSDYRELTEFAQKELKSGIHPKLKTTVKDFDQYDVIYLGSPNWWNTVAPAVMTFLESYDFSGKTIVPFMTHEGSRMGIGEADIRKLATGAKVLKGLPVKGRSVARAESKFSRKTIDMNPKLAIRIGTDFAMFAVLFMLMGYSITGNAIHEWMGIALAVLFGIHISLNFAWVKSIAKGRYTAKRTAGTVINVLMFVATIVTIVSAIPISRTVFRFIPAFADGMTMYRLHVLDVRTHRHTSRYAVE